MAKVFYDANTKRFITATSDDHQPADYDRKRDRKENFPDLEDLPKVDDDYKGKEHKLLARPNYRKNKYKDEDISKSCTDLAIDG